jgi:hypothetical protein
MTEEKLDKCKACGKDVEYFTFTKPSGKHTHLAIHVGDEVPEGAEKISKTSISPTYRHRLRSAFHKDGTVPVKVETIEVIQGETVPFVRKVEDMLPKPIVPKEVVILKPEPVLTELHETPEISKDKPILEIGEMKRNRFAVTGAICRKMQDAGVGIPDVNTARSDLISKGRDFPSLIKAAAPYVQIQEGGQPLTFQ